MDFNKPLPVLVWAPSIGVASLLLLALLSMSALSWQHYKEQAVPSNLIQTPANPLKTRAAHQAQMLLGTWKEDTQSKYVDYIGFLNDGVARHYTGKASTTTIEYINRWQLRYYSNGSTSVVYYDYGDVDYKEPRYLGEYNIVSISDDQLVLSRPSSDKTYIQKFIRVGSAEDEEARSFVRTDAENAALCDALIHNKDITNALLPVTCAVDIGNNTMTTFTFDEKGFLHISQNGKDIFQVQNDGIFEGFSNGILFASRYIHFYDITFDGYLDMEIAGPQGAYQGEYYYYDYDPVAKVYNTTPILSAGNPSVNLKEKTITSNWRGRAIGDTYDEQTYQYRDGKYIVIKTVNRTQLEYVPKTDLPASVPSGTTYVSTTKELQNGKMVITKQEFFTCQEINGDEGQFCPGQ